MMTIDWTATKFILDVLADIAFIFTAIFVFVQVRIAARQLRSTQDSKRVERALDYASRWNDPAYVAWRTFSYEFLSDKKQSHQAKSALLDADSTIRLKVFNTLNILEEMALSCRVGAADEKVCEGFFKTTVVNYYKAARDIIDDTQKTRGSRVFQEFVWLAERWSK